MDAMIKQVDSQRADLGAIQNRLESSIRNQSNIATNESDARSRIRDADFAEESANLSQQSIIQQAAHPPTAGSVLIRLIPKFLGLRAESLVL